MKVLVFNWLDRENPQAGGAEVHLHETFGRLARRGWEVTAVTSGWRGSAPRATLDGIDVHRVGGRYSYPVAARRFTDSALGGRTFSVVVEDLNKAPLFTPAWAPRPQVLLVHHLFGASAFGTAEFPVALATWMLERPIPWVYRETPVVAVSNSTKDDLVRRGLREDRVEVIPNGVDTVRYAPNPLARLPEPTLLYLGRLKRYKRVDLVISAMKVLVDRGLQATLLIAGEGDDEARLRRIAAPLAETGTVRFLGFVPEDEKVRLLQGAWVHVFTSMKEGWGITNLEAASCGTPSVASDSPGLRDSVLHGRTGFLVPHGDVLALADRLEALIRDDALRKAHGARAREFALSLSWDATAERMARRLAGAVDSHAGRD
jgi:glycosyltransferase involved in cell wall biosynthesis